MIKLHGQWLYDRMCRGKVPYESIIEAKRGVRKLSKERGGKKFDTYRCRFCGAIHICPRRKLQPQE